MARRHVVVGIVAALLITPNPVAVFERADLGAALMLLEPGVVHEQGPIDPFDPLAVEYPEPRLTDLAPLAVWATHYSIPRVNEVLEGVPLLDLDGVPLGPMLSLYDFCRSAIGGTVEVTTKRRARRLYTYVGLGEDGGVDCTPWFPGFTAVGRARFRRTWRVAPVLGGTMVVPYRTIAVDPSVIPLGAVVYIPAARGTVVTLDDGSSRFHDGYFYAVDTGGGVDGAHVDVYLGFATANPFIFVRSDPHETFEAFVIDDPDLEDALAEAHGTIAVRAVR